MTEHEDDVFVEGIPVADSSVTGIAPETSVSRASKSDFILTILPSWVGSVPVKVLRVLRYVLTRFLF